MQKIYVFMPYTITNVGGAQLYIKNKATYLIKNGWDIKILQAYAYSILIDFFSDNKLSHTFYEFNNSPVFFSSEKQMQIINQVEDLVLSDNPREEAKQIIIESNTIPGSFWGELIAKKLTCKHFVFILNESYGKLSLPMLRFFEFKHSRKELVGIHRKSLSLLFREYKKLEEDESYYLKAAGSAYAVADICHPVIDKISKTQINIGSISRLSKSFVPNMVDEVIKFARLNQNMQIQLILIGDAARKRDITDIRKKVRDIANLKLIITGFVFPIPSRLFELIDVFVSVSGAARLCAREGALSISLDVLSFQPIGLIGVDTDAGLYSEKTNLPERTIANMLNNILIEKKLHIDVNKPIVNVSRRNPELEYHNHLEFVNAGSKVNEYFILRDEHPGLRNLIKMLFLRIFGAKLLFKLSTAFRDHVKIQ